jgi:acyl-CoA synthetase (NDP forming)
MIGGGGIHIEILNDARFALPPFDGAAALRLIDGLKLRPVLDGVRGRPRADIESLAETAARLSRLAAELEEVIAEIDVNPVLVTPEGAIAVDALVVAAPAS